MEYCDRGDLEQFLERFRDSNTRVPEHKIWRLFLQLATALHHIHKKKIVHADLKPSNILLTSKRDDVKLADFGISDVLSKNYNLIHAQKGSLRYMSPEILGGEGAFNEKTDVWALGCILHEMLTLKPTFHATSEEALVNKIKDGFIPKIVLRDVSPDLTHLYYTCLNRSVEARPTMEEIL